MLVDYHIHTFRCGHAVGTVEEYVRAARGKGLKEFGFADHLPMYWLPTDQRDPELAMSWEELPIYIKEVQSEQSKNPDLSIKLGLEADFIPGHEEELISILNGLPLDYVLGSVHFLGDWAFDDPARIEEYKYHSINDLYRNYFKTLQQAITSGLFDIISHPDLIKKFGFRPSTSVIELYEETVQLIKKMDLCVDVNSAGWRYPCAELYPSPEFLQLCLDYGVPVTLGSDAHKPEMVADGLKRAVDLLENLGFKQLATFNKRKRTMIKLN